MNIYENTPFYGVPRRTAELKRRGYRVNHKRVPVGDVPPKLTLECLKGNHPRTDCGAPRPRSRPPQ